jgi:hypothetical protein
MLPPEKSSVSRAVTPAGVTGVLNVTRTLSELPTFVAETIAGVCAWSSVALIKVPRSIGIRVDFIVVFF